LKQTATFLIALAALIAAFALCAFVIPLAQKHISNDVSDHLSRAFSNKEQELSKCVAEELTETRPTVIDVFLYERASYFCGSQTFALDELDEFDVRMENFYRQMFDTRLILFMVIAITMSGVGLAGLQLLASYKLAVMGHADSIERDHEISIERGKISVKSSVTGIIILVISLAFFVVYIKWVYPINDVNVENSPAQFTSKPVDNNSAPNLQLYNVPTPVSAPLYFNSPASGQTITSASQVVSSTNPKVPLEHQTPLGSTASTKRASTRKMARQQ
jgi:hypothetical protein